MTPTNFASSAEDDLRDARVKRYVVTDSVPPPEGLELSLGVVALAPLPVDAVDRLHNDCALDELLEHT